MGALSVYINYKCIIGLKNFIKKKLALIGVGEKNNKKKQHALDNQKRITIIKISTTTINFVIRNFQFTTLLIFRVYFINGVRYLPVLTLWRGLAICLFG